MCGKKYVFIQWIYGISDIDRKIIKSAMEFSFQSFIVETL